MTQPYSADGSRRTAVFTAIAGFHFGMFLLIASGLVPRPFGPAREPDPPVVRILPPEAKPRAMIVPRIPRPFEVEDYRVPEPHMPLPDFSQQDDAGPSQVADATMPGAGVFVETRAADIVAPRLRMDDDRLAALINACYPAAARRAGEEGRALVHVLVGNDGKIVSWRIRQGTGFPRLDAAVRCIIERLVIEPGRRDGRAVEAEALLPIAFHLD
jgi:protein TonB